MKRPSNKLIARISSVVGVLIVGVLTQKKWIDPMTAVTAATMIGGFAGSTTRETFRQPDTLGDPDAKTTPIKIK